MKQQWRSYGVNLQLSAPSLKKIIALGTSNGSDTPHSAGSSYSGSVLANYAFSGSNTARACQVSGSAIGTGTWLCLGPSGRFRTTAQGNSFNFRWPGLFLRTS